MTDAASGVTTAQITYAARNSDFDGFDIHEGHYLALLDGKLLGTDRHVANSSKPSPTRPLPARRSSEPSSSTART